MVHFLSHSGKLQGLEPTSSCDPASGATATLRGIPIAAALAIGVGVDFRDDGGFDCGLGIGEMLKRTAVGRKEHWPAARRLPEVGPERRGMAVMLHQPAGRIVSPDPTAAAAQPCPALSGSCMR